MSQNDIPSTLESLEAFANLSNALRSKVVGILQECGTVVDIAPKMILFSEQDANVDGALIVLSGTFRVIKPDGFEIEGHAPELLGELGIINPTQRRTATVIAASQMKGLKFSWSEFKSKAELIMNDAEQESLKNAIKEYAWNHFVG